VRPALDVARRISTFDEVTGGLDETNALYEARRCLSCVMPMRLHQDGTGTRLKWL
jgi:NADPH-dependent glutamate synthase beta subunit-like oxidoreductase